GGRATRVRVRRKKSRGGRGRGGGGGDAAHPGGGGGGPGGGLPPVRSEPRGDRRAEREDQGLRGQAGVARRRRGARGRFGQGQRPAAGLGARRGDRAVPAAAAPRVTPGRRLAALVLALGLLALPVAAAESP